MLAPAKGRMMTMTAVVVVVVLVPQPLLATSVMLAPTKGRVMAMMMMAVLMVKRRRILTGWAPASARGFSCAADLVLRWRVRCGEA